MTTINTDPSKRRPLRVQLTILYAGLSAVLVAAVLAVSGLLQRQGETNINGGSSSHNIIFGQHFNVGPFIVTVIAGLVALGLAWWISGRVLLRSAPSASEQQ